MKIAVPVTNGKLSAHFGHCEKFYVAEVDSSAKTIGKAELLQPPAHEPGLLPRWLGEMSVDVVIAGGMGQRAQMLFAENDIEVVVGAGDGGPEEVVQLYLDGQLECGENVCDH